MKFLMALAFLAVVTALPPRQWFGHRQSDDYQIDGPNSHQNKYHQVNLIKLAYKQLIESLNDPPQDDNEEEERAINDIVDTINLIGQIIRDDSADGDSADGDDNNDYNRLPKPQRPQHNGRKGDFLNKPPPGPDDQVASNWQDEKVPSVDGSKGEVITIVDELPASDGNEGDEGALVESVPEENENGHENDGQNLIIAYNSKSVDNDVPAL